MSTANILHVLEENQYNYWADPNINFMCWYIVFYSNQFHNNKYNFIIQAVQVLLEHGADPYSEVEDGTALYWAVIHGDSVGAPGI